MSQVHGIQSRHARVGDKFAVMPGSTPDDRTLVAWEEPKHSQVIPPTGATMEVTALLPGERAEYGLPQDPEVPGLALLQGGPGVPLGLRFVGSGRNVKVKDLSIGTVATVTQLPPRLVHSA